MLKHKIGALLFLVLVCTGGAQARLRLCPGEWGVEGEWIYFLPSVDHPFFALEGSQTGVLFLGDNSRESQLLENPFEFSSGYRVGGGFAFCECDLDIQVRWTHLRTGSKDSSSGDPSAVPLATIPNLTLSNIRLKTNAHITYDSIEGSLGTPLCLCTPLDLVLRLGVEHGRSEWREEVSFSGNDTSFLQQFLSQKIQKKSKLISVGPKVGLDFAYLFGCGLSVRGKADAALLISHVEASRRELLSVRDVVSVRDIDGNITTENTQVGTDKIWRLVPETSLRLGLAYDLCLCNFTFSTELGYEIVSYYNALPIFSDVQPTRTVTSYSNLDMHGLYVNFSLKY